MALNPASKRKSTHPGAQNGSAAARKRAKTFDARTLAAQSTESALSATGELDVAAYLEAREFEIRALESGMQRSKAALTSRAFQQVPRSLRRRTASHNVKRVPSRLRARAKREMMEDNTPTVTARRRKPTELMRIRLETARRLQNLNSKTKAKRAHSKAKRDKDQKSQEDAGSHSFDIAPRIPKIKKNKLSHPHPPESKFKKRQRGKTWLPTHMFHAKRAHMTTSKDALWRFAIPLSPTEKSYRPFHRAKGARGAVAWDMSYMSTIQLEGTEDALESVLRSVGVDGEDVWGPKGKKWRVGTRSLQVWTYGCDGQRNPIAPVTLVRCAEEKSGDVEMVNADNVNSAENSNVKKDRKKLFIRVHPSAFLQLWNELLEVSKRQNPPVMIEDLRFEIGSIDITGPGSTEALISVLRPVVPNENDKSPKGACATWDSLLGVSNPSSLPRNALLAFSVSDPRLNFPHKTLRPPSSDTAMQDLAIALSSWAPDHTQTAPSLFDRRARLAAVRQLPSQKAINRRRTEAGPGRLPTPRDSDPQIPVMLLATRPRAQSTDSNAPGSWTVLLPWKCVLPVWYALIYYTLSSGGNPRFGGLKEQQQLAFEAGEPWFPGDFPGTRAGWEWGLREREQAKKEWERRPKGRRVEFDSLDLGAGQKGEFGRGWACDWEKLIRGDKIPFASDVSEMVGKPKAETKNITPQDGKDGTLADAGPPLSIHHLQPTQADRAVKDQNAVVDNSALATVRVFLSSRGTLLPRARIYRLPTTNQELRHKWLSSTSVKPSKMDDTTTHAQISLVTNDDPQQRLAASLLSAQSDMNSHQEHLPLPVEEDLIGFVTSGNYNLSAGKCTGIGSIQMSKVTGASLGKCKVRERTMCIIRGAGERVGRLGYWELA
ncbi:ribonucleases P/MRP protein subunit POP1-domain-containing protein [Aspergillus coremiiformis]|uniref:Ribonucleases P/MRP protein subunit POP1-domain-containing protein n=1 Tax=Aspergillus coremiiformis TaxID=138285 RepID=A0A5N6YUN9_9EURO|nr:ribonucleases P/MRP protein subunit POP1-domain-containing protein [Aspergillus coremiiformis]